MLAIGKALKRWREQDATKPTGLAVRLITDADAGAPVHLKSVLSVELGASETRAVIPFVMVETVTAGSGDAAALGAAVDAIEKAFNGRAYLLDPDAAIHRLVRRSTTWDAQAGLARAARIEWEGEASVY